MVILGAIAAGLINELHAGWVWWIAAGGTVALWAAIAGRIAFHTGAADERISVAEFGVYTGGKIGGEVHTRATGVPPLGEARAPAQGVAVGRGAVFAREDIEGRVSTEINFSGEPTRDQPDAPQSAIRSVGLSPPPLPALSRRPEPPNIR